MEPLFLCLFITVSIGKGLDFLPGWVTATGGGVPGFRVPGRHEGISAGKALRIRDLPYMLHRFLHSLETAQKHGVFHGPASEARRNAGCGAPVFSRVLEAGAVQCLTVDEPELKLARVSSSHPEVLTGRGLCIAIAPTNPLDIGSQIRKIRLSS